MTEDDITALWADAVRSVTAKDPDRLHTERGYGPEICRWLLGEGLIGLFNGHWAFPNCDAQGRIVSIHRLEEARWTYYPKGQGTHPFVIRGSGRLTSCHDFESQWDAFAVMDRLELYKTSDWMVIITRGAENGALVGNVEVAKDVPVFIWAQEDGELEKHRNKAPENRPSERWINEAKANHNGAHSLTVLRPPEGFKDWNELTRDGISAEQLKEIIAKAQEQAQGQNSAHQFEADTREILSDVGDQPEQGQRSPFPTHCLPPILREMAEATAESTGVHINLPSIALIAVVSASLGKGVYVCSGPNQKIRGNLFIVGSAESGSGKTEGTKPITLPLKCYEFEKISDFRNIRYPQLCSEKRLANKRLTDLERKLTRRPPRNQAVDERVITPGARSAVSTDSTN